MDWLFWVMVVVALAAVLTIILMTAAMSDLKGERDMYRKWHKEEGDRADATKALLDLSEMRLAHVKNAIDGAYLKKEQGR